MVDLEMNNKINNNNTCNCKYNAKLESEQAQTYAFYSKVLNKPFDSVAELREAEAAHYAEVKAKENKVAQKKADAQKVEDALKALNAARKAYKDSLTQLTAEYGEALIQLKKTFEHGKTDLHNKLADAEAVYQVALKEFTDKYDSYHMTLKDGDFETTISRNVDVKHTNEKASKAARDLLDVFDLLFRI